MGLIRVLVVGDGDYIDNDNTLGINMAPTQDNSDDTFTVSELVFLLRNNPYTPILVDTAHRHNDPNATYPNFNFATTVDLTQYDVLWLVGYEGNNEGFLYGAAITQPEVAAIAAFMDGGGGIYATGDHSGLGSYLCGQIPRVGTMRKWWAQVADIPVGYPTTGINYAGQTVTMVNWPGLSDVGGLQRADTLQKNPSDTNVMFQFDDQSDNLPQTLSFPGPVHPILQGPAGSLTRFPDHMHEGEVVTPASLNTVLTINGRAYTEYPSAGGSQPAPVVIATGNMVAGHQTTVDGSQCEQNNFTGDVTPTTAATLGILCAYDGRSAGVGRILTDSSFHHLLDLNLVGDPCGSSPDRMQGFGKAYVTPTAGSVLADMQTFYTNATLWLARVNRNFYFSIDKSTFSYDEASAGSTFPIYFSFNLTVEGYSPNQVQSALGSIVLSGAFDAIPGIHFLQGAIEPEMAGSPNVAQRVQIPYSVQFSTASMGSFPSASGSQHVVEKLLVATIQVAGNAYAAEASFEMIAGEDPYFQNINPQANPPNLFYQSQELCVFTVTAANHAVVPISTLPGVTFDTGNPTGQDDAAAVSFLGNLLGQMNRNTMFTTANPGFNPFAAFPSQIITTGWSAGDSSVTPSSNGFTNYNFAIARVRLSGSVGASAPNVKVFFRLFITQTSDTDYQPTDTYLSQLDAAGLPSAPLAAPDGETAPFFATLSSGGDYAAGGPNNQPITIESSAGAWHYFGCYLNVYNPALNLKQSGTHHCIVAQIAYDDAPIVNSNGFTQGPQNSDKLAQRNMEVTFSDNPGPAASHRVPQTFDLRPTASISTDSGQLLDYPDELMIDWGNTPIGSTASLYWPQVPAQEVLTWAKRLYTTSQLSAQDANTVQCKVTGGRTYVPLPRGTGQRFAGLFTIDLPTTVVRGQEFNIVVQRLSSRQIPGLKARTIEATERSRQTIQDNWRYVVGTFQVKIPVTVPKLLLPVEENTYSILSWRFQNMAPSNRWYPVFKRYLGYIAGRIQGLGGNPGTIVPSPKGVPQGSGGGPHPPGHHHAKDFTGKVTGLVYDRFGDFEGFHLIDEGGHEHAFHSVEAQVEDLARFAWTKRVLIRVEAVEAHPGERLCPARILLLRDGRSRRDSQLVATI